MNKQPDNSQVPQNSFDLQHESPSQVSPPPPTSPSPLPQPAQLSQEPKEKYSFTIETPQQKTFYFKLDEKHRPIKLGDGTYGIAFEVYDSRNQEYAAKLLYQNQETDRSQERFLYEMESSQKIRDLIKQASGNLNTFAGVIDTEGGSSRFHDSPAYSSLKDILVSLQVSSYVLVMPKYERTLKQLLEEERKGIFTLPASNPTVMSVFPTGTPIGSHEKLTHQINERVEQLNASTSEGEKQKIKKELRESIYAITGYEILSRMGFEDRITTMQPYIYEVAQGLKTLHQVQLLHLDLKPANIFVRRKGTKIETVIGDLGFLDEANRETLDVSHSPHFGKDGRPSLPLGTRHYRSPEQKDFFDVADVEVVIGSEIELIIRDPKFNDTIIERGDVVSFSKYKKEFEIASVTSRKVGDNTLFHITLKEEADKGKRSIQQDERTQVYFYKRQRHRTDLFGFGALVFELLTCGKSPERFYDAIRGYDNPAQNIDSIMDLYRQISNFQATEPGLVQIFSPFKLNDISSIYAPPEIVKLILKCMLYKAKNTFYSREGEEQEPGFTMDRVISELEDLYYNSNPHFETSELAAKNKLYQIDSQEAASFQNPSDFSNDLAVLKQLSKQDFPRRLIKGIQYFEKLIQMIQKFTSNEIVYFFELLPKNITQDQSGFVPRYTVYESDTRFLEDLKNDFLYTKINRDPGNPYVPNFFNFIRRTIRLKRIKFNPGPSADLSQFLNTRTITGMPSLETGSPQKPGTLLCSSYEFVDASPYGDMIQKGDWLLIKAKGNLYLWHVNEIKGNGSNCQLCLTIPSDNEEERKDYENAFRMIEEEETEAIFYKDLSPTIYYLNMLGIYIYHLFFVSLDSNNHDKPSLENAIRSFGVSLIEKVKIETSAKQVDKQAKTNPPPKPANQSRSFFGRPKNGNPEPVSSASNHKEEQLNQIILSLASMYLKLVFVESQDSYYSERDKSLEECLIVVKDALYQLKKEIADFLNVEVVRLDNMNAQREKELPQLSNDFGVDLERVSFSFNQLIGSLLRIPLNSEEAYLKGIFQDNN